MAMRTYLTYVPPGSFITKLASPSKIGLFIYLSVILLLSQNIVVNFFLLVVVLAILLVIAKPLKQFFMMFTYVGMITSVTLTIFYLFLSGFSGNVIFQLGPIRIVDRSVYLWGVMVLRFLAMIYTTAILLSTTNQKDILATVEWLRLPWSVSVMLALGFRNMLWFLEDISMVLEGLKSRAMDFEKGSPVERSRKYFSIFVPLVSLSIKRIPSISYALESRGFNPTFKRGKVSFYQTKLRAVDYALLITCLLIGSGFVFLKVSGLMIAGHPL